MESNNQENELTDDQLDSLLRDVELPADLKSQLKMIPAQNAGSTVTQKQTLTPVSIRRSTQTNSWRMWFVAASLLGITAFGVSKLQPTPSIGPGLSGSVAVESETKSSVPELAGPIDGAIAAEMEELESLNLEFAMRQMNLKQLKLDRLESKLVELNRTETRRIDQREVSSLILAMSAESEISFGGSRENAKKEMALVIAEYPGSRGAKIASDFLQQTN